MATEKTSEGIRNFTKDTLKLEQFIAGKLCYQISTRTGGLPKRLLSPPLSSTPSGGEGARRAGKEVASCQ